MAWRLLHLLLFGKAATRNSMGAKAKKEVLEVKIGKHRSRPVWT